MDTCWRHATPGSKKKDRLLEHKKQHKHHFCMSSSSPTSHGVMKRGLVDTWICRSCITDEEPWTRDPTSLLRDRKHACVLLQRETLHSSFQVSRQTFSLEKTPSLSIFQDCYIHILGKLFWAKSACASACKICKDVRESLMKNQVSSVAQIC